MNHRIIESSDVPVRHATRRTGRPFTLVLEKTHAIFERDTADRPNADAGRKNLRG